MLQKIRLNTPEGIEEYPFVPDSISYEAAVAAGEITEGMDIVYRSFLVHIIHDNEMLVLTRIAPMNVAPEFPNGPAGGMEHWTFTVNGIPVDPSQFMNGGATTT